MVIFVRFGGNKCSNFALFEILYFMYGYNILYVEREMIEYDVLYYIIFTLK